MVTDAALNFEARSLGLRERGEALYEHGAKEAGGALALGSADAIVEGRDVMETYALLLAIERRGVDRFPDIEAEFRRIGDDATADVDRVTEDERRHVKYCEAIGRRYAGDDAKWQATVAKYRDVEARAFRHVARATLAYGMHTGLAWPCMVGQAGRATMRLMARNPLGCSRILRSAQDRHRRATSATRLASALVRPRSAPAHASAPSSRCASTFAGVT
jgi:hypothetical protein